MPNTLLFRYGRRRYGPELGAAANWIIDNNPATDGWTRTAVDELTQDGVGSGGSDSAQLVGVTGLTVRVAFTISTTTGLDLTTSVGVGQDQNNLTAGDHLYVLTPGTFLSFRPTAQAVVISNISVREVL